MRKGFTLLELVVAVGIMLIIAAAATPFLLSHIKDSKVAALNENLINIRTAFNSYFTKEGGVITATNILSDMQNKGWIGQVPARDGLTWSVKGSEDANHNKAYYVLAQGTADAYKAVGGILSDLDKAIDGADDSDAGLLFYKSNGASGSQSVNICYLVYKDAQFSGNWEAECH